MSSKTTTTTSTETKAKLWDARWSHPVPHDNLYYAKCVFGGILSCGMTHTAITPLDVVKCNMQVSPEKYPGLLKGMRTVLAEEGVGGLIKGWGPTAVGYSLQGAGKFGFYEFFKDTYSTALGEDNAYKYRGIVYAAASGSAEFFADIMLCPFEMVKVRVVSCRSCASEHTHTSCSSRTLLPIVDSSLYIHCNRSRSKHRLRERFRRPLDPPGCKCKPTRPKLASPLAV